MLVKLLALLFWSLQAATASQLCTLNDILKDPAISQNADFWEAYSKKNGKLSETELQELANKYRGLSEARPQPSSATSSFKERASLKVDHQAQKEVRKLPPKLQDKFDEFLDSVQGAEGIQALYSNPGRWHYEKVKEHGPHAHTVRLNDGYRVLFDFDEQGVTVRRVNKGQIHGN